MRHLALFYEGKITKITVRGSGGAPYGIFKQDKLRKALERLSQRGRLLGLRSMMLAKGIAGIVVTGRCQIVSFPFYLRGNCIMFQQLV